MVQVRVEKVIIPTYEPYPYDRNPMFLEKRVYQGSSGGYILIPCAGGSATHRLTGSTGRSFWRTIISL